MIEGLTPRLVPNAELPDWVEIELTVADLSNEDPSHEVFTLTVLLLVGPPDPNALVYLVPRAVFERGSPVHVGALTGVEDQTEALLEILEVMAPSDIVVFLCESTQTVTAARQALGLASPATPST
jgi:hypothetical protein